MTQKRQQVNMNIQNNSKQNEYNSRAGNTFWGVKIILYCLDFPAALSALATSGTKRHMAWNTPEIISYSHYTCVDVFDTSEFEVWRYVWFSLCLFLWSLHALLCLHGFPLGICDSKSPISVNICLCLSLRVIPEIDLWPVQGQPRIGSSPPL